MGPTLCPKKGAATRGTCLACWSQVSYHTPWIRCKSQHTPEA